MPTLVKKIKLQVKAGQANPAPPVGPVLSQAGVNIQEFCSQFNEKTRPMMGTVIPVVVSTFDDKTFTFELREPPTAILIREQIKIEKGSGEPNKNKVGKITRAQLEVVAKRKMNELNANDLEAAVKIVAGTARSMGVLVEG